MKQFTIVLSLLFVAACGLEPTAESTPSHVRVCRDADGVIVDDAECQPQQHGYLARPVNPHTWWYLNHRNGGYTIGSRVTDGAPVLHPGSTFENNGDAIRRARLKAVVRDDPATPPRRRTTTPPRRIVRPPAARPRPHFSPHH